MNFMGMGILEISVIVLVAFLVMGPAKTIEMTRTAGRVLRDVRKVFNDMAASVDLGGNTTPSTTNTSRPSESETPATTPPGSLPQQPPTSGDQNERT